MTNTMSSSPATQPTQSGSAPSPVLQLDGSGGPVRVAAFQGPGSALTIEAWIRPTAVDHAQAVLQLQAATGSLVLTAGGPAGELALVFVDSSGKTTTLASGRNAVSAGVFTHVAATLHAGAVTPSGFGTQRQVTAALYRQGEPLASGTVQAQSTLAGFSFTHVQGGLEGFVDAPFVPGCYLGGKVGSIGTFQGQLAEVRLWTAALAAADIASRYRARAVGNEPSLAACYHLTENVSGYVYDVSQSRGFGKLPSGSSIAAAASALPLPPQVDASGVVLDVKGKLVTEWILITLPAIGGVSAHPSAVQSTIFDATLVPRSPDGSPLLGKTLYVCPDADVTALVDKGDACAPTPWSGGHTVTVPVPENGQIRLRFLAKDLDFPTLRVRVDGMADGIWTLVRPDREAHDRLAAADPSDLASPSGGKASPLPAGASSADATALAGSLQLLGKAFGPPVASPQPSLASILHHASYKLSWGDVSSTLSGAANTVASGADSLVSQAGQGLQRAGSEAGSLAGTLVDDGSAKLESAVVRPVKAAALLCSGSSLSDLIVTATKAAPRFGAQQIATCIASADALTVVADTAGDGIAHTFAVLGTSTLSEGKVAWRVVCAGYHDAIAATKALIARIGAEIEKILAYLADLFVWGDILKACDEAYSVVEDEVLPRIPALIDQLSSYKDQLAKVLTLPPGVGDKSLAQLAGLDIDPNSSTCRELEYVLELAQRVLGSDNLAFDGIEQALAPMTSGIDFKGFDLSSFQGIADGFSTSAPSDTLSSPVAFVTTPIQGLLSSALGGSAATSFLDYFFQHVVGTATTALSVAQKVIVARIDVPDLTSMIEKGILGGRTLTPLRLICLCAAIPQVVEQKILGGGQSTSNAAQPSSFVAQPTSKAAVAPAQGGHAQPAQAAATTNRLPTWAAWLKAGFEALFTVTTAVQMLYENTAGGKADKGSAGAKTFTLAVSSLDMVIALVNVVRGILTFAEVPMSSSVGDEGRKMNAALLVVSGVNLGFYAGGRIYDVTSGADTGMVKLVDLLKAFHLASSSLTTAGSIAGTLMMAANPDTFSGTDAKHRDEAISAFTFKLTGHITHMATILLKAIVLFRKNATLSKVAIGLSAVTFALDTTTAGLEEAEQH